MCSLFSAFGMELDEVYATPTPKEKLRGEAELPHALVMTENTWSRPRSGVTTEMCLSRSRFSLREQWREDSTLGEGGHDRDH